MPRKTCRRCTPESSKNLILLSICYSITFTLAWVIVSLFKYYAYFSFIYLFSPTPYVIAIVNFRNCFRTIVVSFQVFLINALQFTGFLILLFCMERPLAIMLCLVLLLLIPLCFANDEISNDEVSWFD